MITGKKTKIRKAYKKWNKDQRKDNIVQQMEEKRQRKKTKENKPW